MNRSPISALSSPDKTLKYGNFRIDLDSRTLFQRGNLVDVGPKVVETFAVLVRSEGRYVSKEAIAAEVWPNRGASDESVWRNISTLRKILLPECGDVITTLSRRGYRLEPAALRSKRSPWRAVAIGASAAALAVTVTLGPSPPRPALASFTGPDRELYQVARFELDHRTTATLMQAVAHFRLLAAAHPNNGVALAGLSEALLLRGDYLSLSHAANPYKQVAQRLAQRSVIACRSCAETHAALGLVRAYRDPSGEDGVRELREAVELDPDSAQKHLWLGEALAWRGDDSGALAEYRHAEDLDPTSAAVNSWLGSAYYGDGRLDRAAYYSSRALELDASRSDATVTLAYAYEQRGQLARALSLYRSLRGGNIDPAWRDVLIARIAAVSGAHRRALTLLRSIPRATQDPVGVAVETAGLLGVLGNRHAAIDVLARVVRHEGYVERFTHDRRLVTLWGDPELVALDAAQASRPPQW
jgi:DNA-binding winged helix-turn-helix (wHTH) protein/tetratricopeptide (TPR) repeat protein